MTRLSCTLIGLLVSACSTLRADDWPMWGGRPDRNMVSSEKNLPSTWAPGKGVKWSVNYTHEKLLAYGNPVIAGGRVFIGSNRAMPFDENKKAYRGALLCFSAEDGRFLWQAVHESLPEDLHEDEPGVGISSTPCVVGDRIYYVSNRAELVCRTVQDGKPAWSLDLRKDLGVGINQASASSPLVLGDLVYVVTGQGSDFKTNVVKNPAAPSFIAADRMTGRVVWQDNSPGDRIPTGSWGSPGYGVVDGKPQVAFPGGDGWLYAFEPLTGKLLWKFNCKSHEKPEAGGKPTKRTLIATPVYVGHRVLISVGVEPGNGEDGEVGCLRAIDARKVGDVTATAELWRLTGDKVFGVTISNAVVHEDLVYASELSGYLNCIDLATGKIVWKHDLLTTVWGTPLVADGKVYLQTADGEVHVFAAGRTKKVLATNKGLPGLGNGTPVVSNGVLSITGQYTLYAIGTGK